MSNIDDQINSILNEIGVVDKKPVMYNVRMSNEEIKDCGKRHDHDAIPTLIQILINNTYDIDKVSSAAWALGSIASDQALTTLIQVLPRIDDLVAREKIVWAMGEMKNPRAFSTLVKILKDASESFEVKWAAAIAMKSIGKEEEVTPLIDALKKIMIQKAQGG